jgi:hypothetical protein
MPPFVKYVRGLKLVSRRPRLRDESASTLLTLDKSLRERRGRMCSECDSLRAQVAALTAARDGLRDVLGLEPKE